MDQGYANICLIRSLKKFIFRYQDLMKMYKAKVSTKMSKYVFINVWRKSVFDIYFTEFGAALSTVLPVLFKYCYKYCYSDSRKLWAVMEEGGLAL
jgi:hypothetical protein